MISYQLSKLALVDLEEIWLYTYENWSLEQADRYFELIFNEIETICDNYNIGKNIHDFRKGYMVVKVKSHLIFYKKSENDSSIIEIIRVLHERMDIDNRLFSYI